MKKASGKAVVTNYVPNAMLASDPYEMKVVRREMSLGSPTHVLRFTSFTYSENRREFLMHPNHQSEAELTEGQARIYHFLGRFFVAASDEDFIQSLLDDTVLDAVSECLSEDA